MTDHDELSRLARAITEAEDALNESNHRDNLAQLAKIDADAARRPFLVSEIETAENALKDARAALAAYAEKLSREGAVKVPVETVSDASVWQVAEPQPLYSNGLDGHQED